MDNAPYRVKPALFPDDAPAVAELFRRYAASLPFSLEYQGFSEELAGLPGAYAQPRGAVMLAHRQPSGEPVGVVAVRPLAPRPGETPPPGGICEMKRLFVDPTARGAGVGKMLVGELLRHARAQGYAIMRLDTSNDMHAAHAVYRAFGFSGACRYNSDPDPCTMYFELDLRASQV